MPTIKLTDKTIQGLGAIDGKLTEYRDTEITGLSLLVTPASVRTFNYVYRRSGKQVREKIGRYSATGNGVTLAEAREKARELRRTTELRNDPRAERRAIELAKLARAANVVLIARRFGLRTADLHGSEKSGCYGLRNAYRWIN